MDRIYQFYKASIITVILLYILILVGGFVRITESGDDCPDWPKCYGSWIPPFTIDDIPEEFNPTQDKVYGSWIEYFNRLVGVVLGISMLYTFLKSFYVFKTDKMLFYGSLCSLLLNNKVLHITRPIFSFLNSGTCFSNFLSSHKSSTSKNAINSPLH